MSLKLAEIYAQIPDVECKKMCADFCGPIGMSEPEVKKIRERVGARPLGIQEVDDGVFLFNPKLSDGCLACPLLTKEKQCSVYSDRPAICRLWGTVKKMRCPHGCAPKVFLTNEQARAILDQAYNARE